MGEKIVVGPVGKGWNTYLKPMFIDNDSFPAIQNAFQFRGRVKRKRGTEAVTRLQLYFSAATLATTTLGVSTQTLDLFTLGSIPYPDAQIVPASIRVTISGGNAANAATYTDIGNGTFTATGNGDIATSRINYSTSSITLGYTNVPIAAASNIIVSFSYYSCLPVMGLEDFEDNTSSFDKTIGFDTKKSYNINTGMPFTSFNVSYYKNPTLDATYPSYVPKTTWTPLSWNGQDYQQFWTVNYQFAMWTTNGITVPFSATNVGMHFAGTSTSPALSAAARVSSTTMTFTINGNPLVVGDFVFVNEFSASGGGDASTLNFQTGYVTTAGNTITVTFPNANITAGTYSPGIVQYLTNVSDPTKDCIRWYDGFPVDSNTPPNFINGFGWVNFCPPLSKSIFSIGDLPPAQWYLVGARMIVPFKDRLLFFGPVVQTSSPTSQRFIPDMCIYSQNGTPFYTVSFQGQPENPTTTIPVLVPGLPSPTPSSTKNGQTSSAAAFFSDVQGFGGFVQAGIDQYVSTVSSNEDALIVGFNPSIQTRFVYTGNDIVPFNFFLINTELGTFSPFGTINFDNGVLNTGARGFTMTGQTRCERIDTNIIDQIFQIRLKNNGAERVCAIRDFQNELVYINSNSNNFSSVFPNQSYVYNYREGTWSQLFESFTTYGQFRVTDGFTWATVGQRYPTWESWNTPWNSGGSTEDQPEIIGGNQQGFVLMKSDGTSEAPSLFIENITQTQITSPDHGLNPGDFIIISNVLGTISQYCNNQIFQVTVDDNDTFSLVPPLDGTGTYQGKGVITRLYKPFIQTKQFPTSWGMARKTRLGPQQYLLSATPNGEVQLLIYLSQDGSTAYNEGFVVPEPGVENSSLIYSTKMYTCLESTNLGLTPANTNLQMIGEIGDNGKSSTSQQQIWHRVNTSLIGDTVQVAITMSNDQMSKYSDAGDEVTITGISNDYPAVITADNQITTISLLLLSDIIGMTELNGKYVNIISRNDTTITIDYDTTAFTAYESGGIAQPVTSSIQFQEIELHGFILDVNPSSVLA